ncbi:hypothetical protein GCM10008101_28000 [Lysobacter xinjiangensis]|uniref:Phage integrase family protein n=1 Tax=Cognatilysobacter xinjiangensis TaxID=546892 RepID=A0ABQ3C7J8_9GAMM|nr:hypothetical protein [Lysobacter xinjiangensis]GGZ72137.1 hypothetical protein GCM10008101_28000 [Lysobacter xinjiangensis]
MKVNSDDMAPLWALLPGELEDVPLRGRTLLMDVLRQLDAAELRGVLTAPEDSCAPKRIRNYVLSYLAREGLVGGAAPSRDPEEVAEAIDVLELCLKRHRDTEGNADAGLLVPVVPGPPPLPDGMVFGLEHRQAIDARLLDLATSASTPQVRVGMLAYLLVTRSGLCSMPLIAAALGALAENVPVAGTDTMIWVTIDAETNGQAQSRRVFLDPATLASWTVTREFIEQQLKGHGRREGRKRATHLVRSGLDALWCAAFDVRPPARWANHLMHATAAEVQLDSVPLIAGYARGTVIASSWDEVQWRRLLGCETPAKAAKAGRRVESESSLTRYEQPEEELAVAFPADADDFLIRLRTVLSRPDSRRADVLSDLDDLAAAEPLGSTRRALVGWLRELAVARKGYKPARLSTLRYYQSTLGTRLLGILPRRLEALSGEDLIDLFEEIVDTAPTEQVARRLRNLLRRFHAYCVKQDHRIAPDLKLGVSSGGAQPVSAWHLTQPEYRDALRYLGRVPALDEPDRLAAQVFLTLAYRFGLRRAEILGLTLADVYGGNADCDLEIRSNSSRSLKTASARRRLPLSLLEVDERKALSRLVEPQHERIRSEARNASALLGPHATEAESKARRTAHIRQQLAHSFLFLKEEDLATPVAAIANHRLPNHVVRAIRYVTGDKQLHLHHLRHAFCTRNVLGVLHEGLPEAAWRALPAFIQDMKDEADAFHAAVFAHVGRRARRGTIVGIAAGHNSEAVTLRHYVHGLDLMLHAVLVAARPWQRRTREADASRSAAPDLNHQQARLVSALFGKSTQTRPADGEGLRWMLRQALKRGVNAHILAQRDSTRSSAHVPSPAWTLEQPELAKAPGKPATLVQRNAMRVLLRHLDIGFTANTAVAAHAFETLASNLAKNGWARLRGQQARVLRDDFDRAFGPALKLEYRVPHSQAGRRVREEPSARQLDAWLAKDEARIDVRIADPTAEPGAERQHASLTVAWTLRAVQAWQAGVHVC